MVGYSVLSLELVDDVIHQGVIESETRIESRRTSTNEVGCGLHDLADSLAEERHIGCTERLAHLLVDPVQLRGLGLTMCCRSCVDEMDWFAWIPLEVVGTPDV